MKKVIDTTKYNRKEEKTEKHILIKRGNKEEEVRKINLKEGKKEGKSGNNQGCKIKLTIAIIRRAREKDVILLRSLSWKTDTQQLGMSKNQT